MKSALRHAVIPHRRSGRYGSEDGVGCTAGRCDAQRFDGAAGRERRGPRRLLNWCRSRERTLRSPRDGYWRSVTPAVAHRIDTRRAHWELNAVTAILEEAAEARAASSPSSGRRESARADSPRSHGDRVAAVCRYSRPTANPTPRYPVPRGRPVAARNHRKSRGSTPSRAYRLREQTPTHRLKMCVFSKT